MKGINIMTGYLQNPVNPTHRVKSKGIFLSQIAVACIFIMSAPANASDTPTSDPIPVNISDSLGDSHVSTNVPDTSNNSTISLSQSVEKQKLLTSCVEGIPIEQVSLPSPHDIAYATLSEDGTKLAYIEAASFAAPNDETLKTDLVAIKAKFKSDLAEIRAIEESMYQDGLKHVTAYTPRQQADRFNKATLELKNAQEKVTKLRSTLLPVFNTTMAFEVIRNKTKQNLVSFTVANDLYYAACVRFNDAQNNVLSAEIALKDNLSNINLATALNNAKAARVSAHIAFLHATTDKQKLLRANAIFDSKELTDSVYQILFITHPELKQALDNLKAAIQALKNMPKGDIKSSLKLTKK